MKLKYVGESFGVDSLTDGRVYECLAWNIRGSSGSWMIAGRIIYILPSTETDGRERPGRSVGDRRG